MNGFLKAVHGILIFLLILIENSSVKKERKRREKYENVFLLKAEMTNNAIKSILDAESEQNGETAEHGEKHIRM